MLLGMLRPFAVVLACWSMVQGQEPAVPATAQEPKPAPSVPAKPDPNAVPAVPEGAADLDPVELAKAMNATMRLAAPGPQHQKLAALEGYHEVVMELTPPGVAAQSFPGEARAMSVLGGRYLLLNLRVKLAGVVLEGLYLFGFDNLRQHYTLSWRDSMSTWAVDCTGPLPEKDDGRVPLEGVLVDAASPTGRPFQVVLEFRADGLELSVFDKVKTEQGKVMTQRFVKKPDPRSAAPGANDAKKEAGTSADGKR